MMSILTKVYWQPGNSLPAGTGRVVLVMQEICE